jgi:3-deoxy-D-manno-octulosonic-acid transferase
VTDEHDKEDQAFFEILDKIDQKPPRAKIPLGPRRPDRFIMHRETWEELCALSALFDKERGD